MTGGKEYGTKTAAGTTTAEPKAAAETLEAAVRHLGDWWSPCWTPDITDGEALRVAAERLGVAVGDIEWLCTDGAILCRK